MTPQKLSSKEKFSFVLANLGNIPVQTLIGSFLLIFYTNVCGLNPAACATLFLIARIADGLNDPIVGFVIDHLPRTRLGRFRSPLIIGAILCALNFLLLWFGPMMATTGKLAIAYVSYLLIGVIFPIMDISLNSLLSVMTTDMKERNTLSTIKGTVYMVGAVALSIAAPIILGDTSNRDGYVVLILLAAGMVAVLSVIGALGVKERVAPEEGEKYSFKDLFRILGQKAVWSTFVTMLLYSTGLAALNTINSYYFTYVVGDFNLFGIVSLIIMVAMVVAMLISSPFVAKIGKKRMFLIGMVIFGFLPLIRIIAPTNLAIVMVASVLIGIGQGICQPLQYGIQADNTDYVELHMNHRAEGAVASLSSFIAKCANGIGGAIPGYMLAWAGFDSTQSAQNAAVNRTIILCTSLIPAIFCLIGIILFAACYPLTKEKLAEQNQEIMKRRGEN